MANVLLGCEESQAVCTRLRELGHNAFSCDLQECSGGHPEWHLKEDIFKVIKGGNLITENGESIFMDKWDGMICFPPCTFLTATGARWLYNKDKSRNEQRWSDMYDAVSFAKALYYSDIPKVALENPVGKLSSLWMKPSQIIQPYYFGDEAQKTTCLWLKGLPLLEHYAESDIFGNEKTHVGKGGTVQTSTGKTFSTWYWEASKGKGTERQKRRSKTFPGIAKALAQQYGPIF